MQGQEVLRKFRQNRDWIFEKMHCMFRSAFCLQKWADKETFSFFFN